MAIGLFKTAFFRGNWHVNHRLIYTNWLFLGAVSPVIMMDIRKREGPEGLSGLKTWAEDYDSCQQLYPDFGAE
jgi:hypothetical protein